MAEVPLTVIEFEHGSRKKSRIKVGVSVNTLILREPSQQQDPIRPYRSEQLKPRVSLPELSSSVEPLSRLSLLRQYEFPLQNDSVRNSKKHESKPQPKRTSVSEKVLKSRKRKLSLDADQQDQVMHHIIINAVLTEEITKSIHQAGDALLESHRPKRRVLRSDSPVKRNTLLENLQQSVLFPKILKLKPSRQDSSIAKIVARHLSEPHSPTKPAIRLPQLKPRSRIYDLAVGNIDGWKDFEDGYPLP